MAGNSVPIKSERDPNDSSMFHIPLVSHMTSRCWLQSLDQKFLREGFEARIFVGDFGDVEVENYPPQ